MVLFDLADASWFPLLMVFVIGGLMYLLYRSMRHEIGKISVPPSNAEAPDKADDR